MRDRHRGGSPPPRARGGERPALVRGTRVGRRGAPRAPSIRRPGRREHTTGALGPILLSRGRRSGPRALGAAGKSALGGRHGRVGEGAALAGSSAGAMALGEWTLVRERHLGDERRRYAPALGLVPGVAVLPHSRPSGTDGWTGHWPLRRTTTWSCSASTSARRPSGKPGDGVAWAPAGSRSSPTARGGGSARVTRSTACLRRRRVPEVRSSGMMPDVRRRRLRSWLLVRAAEPTTPSTRSSV